MLYIFLVVPTSSTCDAVQLDPGSCFNPTMGFICDFCDEWNAMLVAAYFELILPFFFIGGSFLFRKDVAHLLCLNVPAVLSIIAGSLFLPLDSKSTFFKLLPIY